MQLVSTTGRQPNKNIQKGIWTLDCRTFFFFFFWRGGGGGGTHEGQKLVGLKSSIYPSNLIILVIKTYIQQGVPNNKNVPNKDPLDI